NISSNQKILAQDAINTVSNLILDRFDGLETVVKLANPIDSSAKSQKITFESLLGHDVAYQQFALLDARGRQVAHVSRLSQTLSPQFMAQLKGEVLSQTSTGQRYISPVYINEATNEPLVVIAV